MPGASSSRRMRSTHDGCSALAVALLLALCGGGCAQHDSHRNVLLIVVDTLRAGHLGAYGYPLPTSPVLDQFAAENLRFAYAISAAPWTSPSMASIFTAHYPTAHGVTHHVTLNRMPDDAISEDFATLAEVLQAAGYATAGITANAWVSDKRGYAQGFDRFDTIDFSPAPQVNALAFERLAELRESEPFFLYLHYMDPHTPMSPPRALLRRFHQAQRSLPPQLRPLAPKSALRIAAYDGEIAFLDQALGDLFAHLQELGLYDDMLIAFTSDHGYAFFEHGVEAHGRKLHNEDTHVPLILKLGDRRGVVETPVSTIDLYPTLLAALGLEPPRPLQGVSLLDQLETRAARGVFSENTVGLNHRSLVGGDATKLILAFDKSAHEEVSEADEQGVVGLFRSRDDYGERTPVESEAETAELRARLWATYRQSLEINRSVAPARGEIPPESVEELRRLGYVE